MGKMVCILGVNVTSFRKETRFIAGHCCKLTENTRGYRACPDQTEVVPAHHYCIKGASFELAYIGYVIFTRIDAAIAADFYPSW